MIVIDQGWDTFEASSGDNWVSGAQSYRAYLNGSTTATIVADYIRRLGYPAQAHSNAHGDVMQIPLMLLAGLGEMSRIGELVLNPFIGPRHKTAIVTTDLPLVPDRPIDFGLQDFCDKCRKCARECPAQAIPFGDKVLYNGYEIWKPDVEKCTKYRVTNLKGSACGRCMKMCPWNKEGLLAHRLAMWAAIKLPFSRRFLIWLDDALGYGKRNPIKRWWLDLVKEDGRVVAASGTNERDLALERDVSGGNERVATYPVDKLPTVRRQGDRAAGPQGGARRYEAGGGRAGRAQGGGGADALSSLSLSPTLRARPSASISTFISGAASALTSTSVDTGKSSEKNSRRARHTSSRFRMFVTKMLTLTISAIDPPAASIRWFILVRQTLACSYSSMSASGLKSAPRAVMPAM